jgi:hypothetical protein
MGQQRRQDMDKNDLWMEDVASISLEAMEIIQRRLAEKGVVLTDKTEDEIYVPMHDAIEKFSNGNYRHEH